MRSALFLAPSGDASSPAPLGQPVSISSDLPSGVTNRVPPPPSTSMETTLRVPSAASAGAANADDRRKRIDRRGTARQGGAVMGGEIHVHLADLVDRTEQVLLPVPGEVAKGGDAGLAEADQRGGGTRILLAAIAGHALHPGAI